VGAVAVWTWVGAVVLALVILGFCAYEIAWKTRRLGQDVEGLQKLQVQLRGLQQQVADAQTTVVTIQENRAGLARRNGDVLFPHPEDSAR
jgi:hypothetical protein